jgi:peptidoglycan hydrolase CwlO-like protein
MQTDYYVLAHGQAANDRAQLRAEIEKLLARDAKLEQLIDILKEFIPAQDPAEASAAASHEEAASEAHAEAPADNHHAESPVPESHEQVPEHAGA